MIIEHNNWAPASDLFDEMQHFTDNVIEITGNAADIPDFNENLKAEPHLTLDEIEDRANKLIRLNAKVEATIEVLKSIREAYHRYQEMYFENL